MWIFYLFHVSAGCIHLVCVKETIVAATEVDSTGIDRDGNVTVRDRVQTKWWQQSPTEHQPLPYWKYLDCCVSLLFTTLFPYVFVLSATLAGVSRQYWGGSRRAVNLAHTTWPWRWPMTSWVVLRRTARRQTRATLLSSYFCFILCVIMMSRRMRGLLTSLIRLFDLGNILRTECPTRSLGRRHTIHQSSRWWKPNFRTATGILATKTWPISAPHWFPAICNMCFYVRYFCGICRNKVRGLGPKCALSA